MGHYSSNPWTPNKKDEVAFDSIPVDQNVVKGDVVEIRDLDVS